MAIQAQRYLRKPLYVDAVRITSANFEEISAWCQGEILRDEESGSGKKYIKVRVHNPKNPRQTKAFVGDWLLYTERGYKVYTSKAFHAAFDRVEATEAPVSDPRLTGDPVRDAQIDNEPSMTTNEAVEAERQAGIKVTVVDATPQAIANAAQDNHKDYIGHLEGPATGKRVLSKQEQEELTSDEVRELVQSGEVVLAQDIAHS